MLNIKAVMERKPVDFNYNNCAVEKVAVLSGADFDRLVAKPYESHDFIKENRGCMWMHDGTYHCLMVLGENRDDAMLIEAEGYDYPRYAAFIHGGRMLIEKELELAADFIIQNAAPDPQTRSWVVWFDGLKDATELEITENNGFGSMLLETLQRRPEIADIDPEESNFEITCQPEFYNVLAGLPSMATPGASQVGTPVTTATEALKSRITANLTAFERDWMSKDPAWLIANAQQIACTKQAYTDIFAYASEEHMEYLLRFQNPLEVVRDAYQDGLGFSQEADLCCSIDHLIEKGYAEQCYELDAAYTEQTQVGGMEMG